MSGSGAACLVTEGVGFVLREVLRRDGSLTLLLCARHLVVEVVIAEAEAVHFGAQRIQLLGCSLGVSKLGPRKQCE